MPQPGQVAFGDRAQLRVGGCIANPTVATSSASPSGSPAPPAPGGVQAATAAPSSSAGSSASTRVTGTRLLFWYGVRRSRSRSVPVRATGRP